MQWYEVVILVVALIAPVVMVLQGIMLWSLRLRVEALERNADIHHETLVEHWKEMGKIGNRVEKLDTRRY